VTDNKEQLSIVHVSYITSEGISDLILINWCLRLSFNHFQLDIILACFHFFVIVWRRLVGIKFLCQVLDNVASIFRRIARLYIKQSV
jgi:hypothetical protein